MPRRFSREFATYQDWSRSQGSSSGYSRRIARGHARYPSAGLGQLRRHPKSGQTPLGKVRRAPPARVPLAFLGPKEQLTRRRALDVVSEARRGKGSLSKLSRARGIAPKTVRRASGAFRKQGGRWVVTKTDRVQRWLKSYEGGYRTEVLVNDSRTASLLSRYANAVGRYRETGDPSGLSDFEGKTYKDALGNVHSFETDPAALRDAFERSESDFGAFATIYVEPGEVEEGD
jgi:hypothetical protein